MEHRPNDNAKEHLLAAVREATIATYGDRLVAVAVFGSWARGTATPASDLDLLVVAEPLPPSRMKRVREFLPVTEVTRRVGSKVWPNDAEDSDVALGQARLAAECLGRLLGRRKTN